MKKLLIVLVIVVVGFFVIDKFRASSTTPEEKTTAETNTEPTVKLTGEPLRIGGIAPLTGDGASYGIMTQRVANLRVEEVNASGGINGRPLEIIWEDGKCTPGEASRGAQKLIGIDKVSVILGGTCSGETLGAAPIAERNKVILFSGVSSSPEITHVGDFVFRTAPSDSSQGRILAEYANKHFKRVGMLSEQTDYAIGVADTFENAFTGNVIREDYLSTEADFKTRITKLKNENLDVLFINSQTPEKYEIILKQLQEQNWNTPFLTNEVEGGDAAAFEMYKDLLTKNKVVSGNFVSPEKPALTAFIEKYKAEFQEPPMYVNYTGTVLDAVDILTKVLREAADVTDTEALRDALYQVKNFPGIYDNISLDENGDSNIVHSLYTFDGEKLVPLAE